MCSGKVVRKEHAAKSEKKKLQRELHEKEKCESKGKKCETYTREYIIVSDMNLKLGINLRKYCNLYFIIVDLFGICLVIFTFKEKGFACKSLYYLCS